MNIKRCLVASALALAGAQALAWGNHTIPTLRALEQMPELVKAAPVKVETLESFLKAEEKTIEALLASQEAWAVANIENYPKRPDALAFAANPQRSDDARRMAFLMALRVAPNSKFALFYQPDPAKVLPEGTPMVKYSDVNTLPEPSKHNYRFVALKPGDMVPPLAVVTTAADEPDYGLDINCWSDSPADWGKVYNFGNLPFGNPALPYSTQAPFHMGFFHESGILYAAAPFIQRTFPLLRSYQYWSLAALAFRTGHPYWGWRFAGISLHYIQDLTQPYHARLAPGVSTLKLLGANILAMAGMTGLKDETIVLLSNRHLVVDKYQNEKNFAGAKDPAVDPLEKALADTSQDGKYPAWSDRYVRDVVTKQSSEYADRVSELIAQSVPAKYVGDPKFDFGTQEANISLIDVLSQSDPKARDTLDSAIAELLANFGAHTRNEIRSILKASSQQ
ncbi:hypothetical protein RQP54_15505 [Curvibacter sp. APW13]|uniref:hypothetical protein n=1 Tax=Curvibacter sp. APW13 TaxID=3077236 RepID=UPI0028E091D8|nr:hypothetical protein [Curvibacter sp. APW13]MDT8992278.1 hypothetical protein [Curvibacter sp. APW13]